MQAKDAPTGQIGDHQTLNALTGVDHPEWNLIATKHHAMAQALLFHDLLEFTGIGVTGSHDTRLAVSGKAANVRESPEVATENHAAALEEVRFAHGRGRHAGHDVLIGKEGARANGVLSVPTVGGLVNGSGEAVAHSGIATSERLRGHQQHIRAFFGRVGSGGKSRRPVTKHHNVPDFHFDASDKRATKGRAIRPALGPKPLLRGSTRHQPASEVAIR